MDARLQGRHVLITGAASGIGRATAELFARHGARLALLDRDAAAVREVARQFDAFHAAIDVADEALVRAAVRDAAQAMDDTIDAVVNSAGMAIPAPLADTRLEDWNRVLAVNLTGPFLLCREALPWLRRAEGSTIVNVSSGSALLPVGMAISSYVASKSGLIALTKALASELGPQIRANAVCPGAVDTPLLPDVLRVKAQDPAQSPYALKRIATPEEIAQAILYLTSSESSYVTGTALAVDGGRTFH
ncbi:NAD(P)-dependent dehydrogenase, short-chain alcohol dehydrogenase family [Variovorax sp. HW608]|uniref:SDR family NAD(P)-dependent oxidoreductase n=1 Tax=Variovorax sp. HW608 TaxID=1034889 RepID=UPI00081F804E|nr:SDR family NAD(P)-dependent oxidoreductase [Variovorax sp. HW608]SCK10579.1 NAD(P)-dependent dehydrogenase, short-chain alcohol dehydrogenase family [Variovorax sp. HW608]